MKICPVCATEFPDDVRFCPNDGQTLRSSSPGTDLVGQVVADRYHVLKKLGEGGMGQVYLAEHVKMGRRSAIKVMNPSMVLDPDAVARFNREAANASRISHPSVCAIYDFGETPEGLIYLAMEYIEGEPLTDLLAREGAQPVARAADITIQVAGALQAAHDLGIVHRDLKPDNIMLTRGRDGSDVVKVVDFGIAKAMGGDDSQKVTKTGLVVGTPEFMSPEQLSGDKVDGRSDVYSLGLVLFKMLTGTLPFPADSVQEAMIKRLTDEPWDLIEVRPDLRFPPGVQETLDAALARSPVDRYQSALKFADDLAAVLGVPRASRASPWPATRPDAAAETELLRRPTPTAVRPLPPRRRSRLGIVAGAVVVLGGAGAAVALLGRGAKTAVAPPTDAVVQANGGVQGDTGGQPDTAPLARHEPPKPRPREVRSKPRIDLARVQEILDTLFLNTLTPITAAMVRDSATHIFYAAGIADSDKAYAAFVIGHTYIYVNDRAQGCRWIKTATELAPQRASYQKVLARCGG